MNIWLDAQLSPAIAQWMEDHFKIKANPVRELGLRDAKDSEIFRAARDAEAVVLTKDADFPHLLSKHGPPPKVLWLTCGNTSNANLKQLLNRALPEALRLLEEGESVVQISGPTNPFT